MSDVVKSCINCRHRDPFWGHCERVGYHCTTELRHGGICVKGAQLRLWSPKRGVFERLKVWLFGGAP